MTENPQIHIPENLPADIHEGIKDAYLSIKKIIDPIFPDLAVEKLDLAALKVIHSNIEKILFPLTPEDRVVILPHFDAVIKIMQQKILEQDPDAFKVGQKVQTIDDRKRKSLEQAELQARNRADKEIEIIRFLTNPRVMRVLSPGEDQQLESDENQSQRVKKVLQKMKRIFRPGMAAKQDAEERKNEEIRLQERREEIEKYGKKSDLYRLASFLKYVYKDVEKYNATDVAILARAIESDFQNDPNRKFLDQITRDIQRAMNIDRFSMLNSSDASATQKKYYAMFVQFQNEIISILNSIERRYYPRVR